MAFIVPAAGCGARAALDRNKILAPLCGRPLLSWTLETLLLAEEELAKSGVELREFFIAARREEWELLEELIGSLQTAGERVNLVEGGASRQESVGNAARHARSDFLLIHDAARPLVSKELVARVVESALHSGAAIAAVPAADTVKIARISEKSTLLQQSTSVVQSTLERERIWLAQTPQVFRRKLYLDALSAAERSCFDGTDCASLLEKNGIAVSLVEGEPGNFKVTYRDDLARAEAVLSAREIELY